MDRVDTPQSRCRAGMARADITPPVGIYHRMWGAATHEQATGVHRPLLATALWLEPWSDQSTSQAKCLVLALDHCILESAEIERIREEVGRAAGLLPGQVQVTLSHTHGSGWMSLSRANLPGGELIGPYFEEVRRRCAALAVEAAHSSRPATIVYGQGRSSLAAHRDYWDVAGRQYVCGYNPEGPTDETVLVASMLDESGALIGTIINYACHPTTLAWENTRISPDYVGSMRETVEQHTGAPCLFLQGASGDLGPREGFVGASEIADRNGRQLGFAALSALESLPPRGTRFMYAGAVVSGATLGTWQHRPLDRSDFDRQQLWQSRQFKVDLPYRFDLPTLDDTRRQLAHWKAEEERARVANDALHASECRAHVERMTRQVYRLQSLPAGPAYPYPVSMLRLGDAVWLFAPGELYHIFQTTLRSRFPARAIVVATLTGDWQPGYLPTAASYGRGIYQEIIAAVGPGSLELLIEAVSNQIRTVLSE